MLLNVFDTRTGKKLRIFSGNMDEYAVGSSAGPGGALRWPLFKWAGGGADAYFARLAKGAIKVYEAPEMTQLDKRDLKLDGVMVRRLRSSQHAASMRAAAAAAALHARACSGLPCGTRRACRAGADARCCARSPPCVLCRPARPRGQDFEWSPAEPLLAAYTQEVGDRPANISIIRIPERTNVRSKQLFNVSGERRAARARSGAQRPRPAAAALLLQPCCARWRTRAAHARLAAPHLRPAAVCARAALMRAALPSRLCACRRAHLLAPPGRLPGGQG